MKKAFNHPKVKGPLVGSKYVFMGGKVDGKRRIGAEAMVVAYNEKIHNAIVKHNGEGLPYIEHLEKNPDAMSDSVLLYRDKGDVWEIIFQRSTTSIEQYMTDRIRSHVALPVDDFKDEKAIAWRKLDDDDVYVWIDATPYAKKESIEMLRGFGLNPRIARSSSGPSNQTERRTRKKKDNSIDWLIGLGIVGAGVATVIKSRRVTG